ncbi:uncharacterized protein BDV14DRAFT_164986 [Aspergillus stella-maris]|uniref:uncharacterized protein n=1 Tax=Aspergillus stella-maris TaxID=1810926 RepID=UPI003CCDB749
MPRKLYSVPIGASGFQCCPLSCRCQVVSVLGGMNSSASTCLLKIDTDNNSAICAYDEFLAFRIQGRLRKLHPACSHSPDRLLVSPGATESLVVR